MHQAKWVELKRQNVFADLNFQALSSTSLTQTAFPYPSRFFDLQNFRLTCAYMQLNVIQKFPYKVKQKMNIVQNPSFFE